MRFHTRVLMAAAALALLPASVAQAQEQQEAQAETSEAADNPFAIFIPTTDPIRHRIDYDVYDFALKNLVVSMGPSTRSRPFTPNAPLGTRLRQGHNSRYRLEGSMVGFSFFNTEVTDSLGEYRRELVEVANSLDISSLPRNEQLAFWFNLHNVAMLEFIAREYPVRQPREIMVDGVHFEEAPIFTIRGVSMSLKDIREKIVFANWRNPKVIYGFWRGEIGGPALEREAFTGSNVGSLLDLAAEDFINSLRGTQKNGDTLEVSTLYQDAARFYFPDFAADVRAHIGSYANEDVTGILESTQLTRASIREWDIADLAGGARGANYLASSRPGLPPGAGQLLRERQQKLDTMERRDIPTGRVIFSNIDLPGDPPNKNAVE